MIDVSSQNNSVSINVSSGGNSASINATPDMAQYYSEKSREWAISNRIVDNTEYSSKYYAEKSKESEAKTENYERSVIEKYNSFIDVSNEAEASLQTLRDDSISQINTATSSGISDIANKTSEAVTEINSNKETATNEINNVKNNAVTQLSKEAQEQLKNIESTGFYMRDDKLYFINSKGEEEEFAGALVSQMENKANIFLDNTIPSKDFKVMASSYGMPSNKYDNLQVGANGTTYTAPANGWFVLRVVGLTGSTSMIRLQNNTNGICSYCTSPESGSATAGVTVPALKGDVVTLGLFGTYTQVQVLRFVYAQGEV